MTEGRLFVISAPSGAGKTTLLKRVMTRIPGVEFSVSHTTREPRVGEEDRVDYHFISSFLFSSSAKRVCSMAIFSASSFFFSSILAV